MSLMGLGKVVGQHWCFHDRWESPGVAKCEQQRPSRERQWHAHVSAPRERHSARRNGGGYE
jgi:hypothetical protein